MHRNEDEEDVFRQAPKSNLPRSSLARQKSVVLQSTMPIMPHEPTGSERREHRQMKYLAIAIALAALSFGGCAKEDTGYTTTHQHHSSSTGYSK
jgi:hypothetical protein